MIQHISKHIDVLFTEDGFTSGNSIYIRDSINLVIDSGAGSILSDIEPSSVDILINSHHHLDHVRGNDTFSNAKIFMHPLEKEAMKFPERISATWGWENLMEQDLMECAGIFGGLSERLYMPWRVDGTIQDEQVIDCGSTSVHVIHTPGHTAGHCSFYFPDEGMVFLGDICMTAVGPWYGDEWSSIDEFIGSINRIIDMKPAKIVSGHRKGVIEKDIYKELVSYRDRIYKREQRIIDFIREKPASIDEISAARLIYREHPSVFVLFWEKTMIKKHIANCMKKGSIEEVENGMFRSLETTVHIK